MPVIRSKVGAKKSNVSFVRALYFPGSSPRYIQRDVCTVSPSKETTDSPSFPAVEHILGTGHPIHETTVTIVDREFKEQDFLIFYQYDLHLPVNRSVRKVTPTRKWRGEVVVMKRGEHRFVRSLQAGYEALLAVQALERFMHHLWTTGGPLLNPEEFPTEFLCDDAA